MTYEAGFQQVHCIQHRVGAQDSSTAITRNVDRQRAVMYAPEVANAHAKASQVPGFLIGSVSVCSCFGADCGHTADRREAQCTARAVGSCCDCCRCWVVALLMSFNC